MTEAVVVGAEVVAGHDGAAELLVTVRHENGVTGHTILPADVGFAVMRAAGADNLNDLAGLAWGPIIRRVTDV